MSEGGAPHSASSPAQPRHRVDWYADNATLRAESSFRPTAGWA
ncbi:hypothetical protein [Plantactinospora sp. BC1]|nr:hypothetical protein [Plantactinospora sp. BC1]